MADKEFTYSDVSEHTSKNDVYVVIHENVYNASGFVDEHPGGEEVLLDVGGQDATEAFEDVGHSDEAREILRGLLIGKLKRSSGEAAPTVSYPPSSNKQSKSADGAGLGVGLYALVLVVAVLGFVVYRYMQAKTDKI